jgi:xyloglucan-specific exo-beta-1,4-glucanase
VHVKKTVLGLALAAASLLTQGAMAENYRWDTVAMGGGGFVTGIVTSKSERGLVYARTDVGGAYRYDNQNGRWVSLSDWLSPVDGGLMGVDSLAIDPRNAANVYMLAGTEYISNGKTAILRSTDYGKTFTTVDVTAKFKTHGNGTGRGNGERLQVDPGSSDVLFVGTRHNGLFKSLNAGATWNRVTSLDVNETPNGVGISFVLLDPSSVKLGKAQRIFVGVSRYGSVGPNLYVSKNAGASFSPVAGAPAGLMPQRAALTSKGRLYLTYANGAGPHWQSESEPLTTGAIWEYNTAGTGSWTNVTPANRTHAFGGISIDPANPNHLVASSSNTYWTQQILPEGNVYGERVYTSLDAGRSWTDVVDHGNGLTLDPNGADWVRKSSINWAASIEFDPFDTKTVWMGFGGGVVKTSNIDATQTTWKFEQKGMEETGVYSAETLQNGTLVSVFGDVDGYINSAPDQYGVQHSPKMGSTTGLAIAPQAQHVMARVGNDLYTSTNTGASWEKAASMMASRGNLALSADGFVLLHSPENTTTTYRSTNAGGSWTAVTGLSVNNARPVADALNPNKFYVYDKYTGKMFVSTDGGVSFNLGVQLSGGGSTFIRPVAGREGDLWICLGLKGLAHSTDSGATFTKVGQVANCEAVGLGKEAPGANYPTLYISGAVGTATGMMRSTDKGVSWVRINDDHYQYGGGHSMVVGDMNTYGVVYRSTNGRGIAYGKIDPSGDVVVTPQAYVAPPKPAECKYVVTNTWDYGAVAEIRVTNRSNAIMSGWTVNWTYADDTVVDGGINGTVTGTAPNYTGTTSELWNYEIQPGQTQSFGMWFHQGTLLPGALPAVTGDICK